MLTQRLTKQGFLIFDYPHLKGEAVAALAAWHRHGLLVVDEQVSEGLATAPASLVEVLAGKNQGKRLIRVA